MLYPHGNMLGIYRLNPKCSWLSHVISSVW
jgi:hypothetical protein